MSGALATLVDNRAWSAAAARLAVVVPFFRYDPTPLLRELDRLASRTPGNVELVVLDDGGGDPDLARSVIRTLSELEAPARFIGLSSNQGRARGRNRLVENARAHHILLIDCDMAPDHDDFLQRYLALVDGDVAVAFGGFSVSRAQPETSFVLHHALQQRGECLPASVRGLQPEKYVYTSNLLVRRDVFQSEAFDEAFTGWGWEDVEWGMRVAERFGVQQIDNTACHLGLDTAEALARKYEQSAGNFARVVARHPQVLTRYPSYKVARLVKRLPIASVWRALFKALALSDSMPLTPRIMAMKLYRASIYATVV